MRNSTVTPDAVVRVYLFASDAGGRSSPIPPRRFKCPVAFSPQGEMNDCAFLLDEVGVTLEPGGKSQIVPVKFLNPELAAGKLRIGARFTLWEGRYIGGDQSDPEPQRAEGTREVAGALCWFSQDNLGALEPTQMCTCAPRPPPGKKTGDALVGSCHSLTPEPV